MRRLARPSRNVLMDFGAGRPLFCLLIQNFQHFRLEINPVELDPKFIWSSKYHALMAEGGKDGETCSGNGLLKLQDDVKMCGYEDVQVMWDLLNSPEIKQIGAATTTVVSSSKQWPSSWTAISWHNQGNTASSSSFCWVKSGIDNS
ncbi:hypothetical protein Godav_006710 [Gossypium davidsonii]|uniref:Uncharacterized protein n=2 Tax=Gossypium TaxID=3633 RepID=A0A7J8S4L8_GOSDV|nr:hypothetical protein [Gossypium lobatum]MBA0621058.1 hypothetical protein [Gossypium davidsonii]